MAHTIVKSQSSEPFDLTVNIPFAQIGSATAVPATPAASYEYILTELSRRARFREAGVVAHATVVSGAPATNTLKVQLKKYDPDFTNGTIMATATITGASTGTALQRGVYKSIATLSQFLQTNAVATAKSIISAIFTAAPTMSAGFKGNLILRGDYID